MRIQTQASFSLFSTLLPGLASAISLTCTDIHVDKVKFDFSPLAGVHTLNHIEEFDDYTVNTTYVLNICNVLNQASVFDGMKCGRSRNICGFQHIRPKDGAGESEYAFPIAGLDTLGHGSKDVELTRLKQLDPDADGLRLKISGGEYREDSKSKTKNAAAVIEFQCDPNRTGLEDLHDVEDVPSDDGETEDTRRRRAAADDGNDNDGKKTDPSLTFKSWGPVDDKSYILRLDWKSKYACEDYAKEHPTTSEGGHWGFFTWLIIIVFLGVAAYLIFGSWLNYNRYGARGWDLLPHGDTVRDIPYIFQDWVRRVINTLSGSGSRGGYSAV